MCLVRLFPRSRAYLGGTHIDDFTLEMGHCILRDLTPNSTTNPSSRFDEIPTALSALQKDVRTVGNRPTSVWDRWYCKKPIQSTSMGQVSSLSVERAGRIMDISASQDCIVYARLAPILRAFPSVRSRKGVFLEAVSHRVWESASTHNCRSTVVEWAIDKI
ncbi:uncharacterized protein BT62DRAFT_1075600 [Guyanagaster necrorhizus]|uniref:Uncharacterized protein n=1 Tax=Guyanagaster necrorhizus TaxID=856835 RepID=A0A9P7VUJ7_9AGAR|nr:uncharacterized protein BT62DRAFT_1075600 [Guyanagaster necrorhizus MCA 3950]KAG7446847.1 hypothetical protein BT62DRAFT_1075600 [Guyanagaster necrorhizus MCA 3950]